MKGWTGWGCGLLGLMLAVPAGGKEAHSRVDCAAASTRDAIGAVLERPGSPVLALRLESGREVYLAGIRLEEGPEKQKAAEWLRGLAGRGVSVAALAPPDRWGREAVGMVVEEGRLFVQWVLVDAGLAVVDPVEQDALCWRDLLRHEAAARGEGSGLWAGLGLPLRAEDGAGLAAKAGRFAIVEGRPYSVRERGRRVYLNFGGFGTGALTATMAPAVWREFLDKGLQEKVLQEKTLQEKPLTDKALRRHRLRLRGTIAMGRGPMMEIRSVDAIERLEP